MLHLSIVNPKNKRAWYSCTPWKVYSAPSGNEEVLVIEDYVTAFGVFKAVSRTTTGTTTVVTPRPGGSLVLTDIIISAEKSAAGGTVEILFTDGSNTETIIKQDVGNSNLSFAHTVKGRMQGWRDARLDLVTAGQNTDVFVTIGFLHLPSSLVYEHWTDLR